MCAEVLLRNCPSTGVSGRALADMAAMLQKLAHSHGHMHVHVVQSIM